LYPANRKNTVTNPNSEKGKIIVDDCVFMSVGEAVKEWPGLAKDGQGESRVSIRCLYASYILPISSLYALFI